MGWLIKAIAIKFLAVLDDMMVWGSALITNLQLDIGIDKDASAWSFVDPSTAGLNSLLAKTFPGASNYCYYFLILAMILVFIIVLFKLWQGFISPFTDAEPPGGVIIRGCIAAFGVMASYTIFVTAERIFNKIFKNFKSLFDDTVDDAGFNQFKSSYRDAENQYSKTRTTGGSNAHVKEFWSSDKLIDSSSADNLTGNGSGTGFTLMIIECIIGFALLFSFLRLVLEVYERYLIVGLLFYTCPLAFALLASKSTKNIVSNWFQMLISQFILMCMNLFFVGTFISAFTNILKHEDNASNGYIFASDQEFVTTMLLLLGWTIIAQKADEYMKGLGLSVANTGQGLGAALVAGVGATWKTAQLGYKSAKDVARGTGKVGKAAHGWYQKIGSPGEEMAKSAAERMESASNDLMKAGVGAMTAQEFQKNVNDRGGLDSSSQKYSTSDIDYGKSAALSGKGAQVLADKNGNIVDIGAMPGSAAAKALEAKNFMTMQDPKTKMIKPITESDMAGLSNQVKSMGMNGRLPGVNGVGVDPTRYDKAIDMGHSEIKFVDSKTGNSRTFNTAHYYNVSGSKIASSGMQLVHEFRDFDDSVK